MIFCFVNDENVLNEISIYTWPCTFIVVPLIEISRTNDTKISVLQPGMIQRFNQLCVLLSQNIETVGDEKGIDILFTKTVPNNLCASDQPNEDELSTSIARDISRYQPRYIFTSQAISYKKVPFKYPYETHSGRLVCLGQVSTGNSNDSHKAWLYGLNYHSHLCGNDNDNELISLDCIQAIPFPLASNQDIVKDSTRKKHRKPPESYICYNCNIKGDHFRQDCASISEIRKPDSCWFCLANGNCQKHLILLLGNYIYLSITKGGLTSIHFIICPIEHISCYEFHNHRSNQEIQKYLQTLYEAFVVNQAYNACYFYLVHPRITHQHAHAHWIAYPSEQDNDIKSWIAALKQDVFISDLEIIDDSKECDSFWYLECYDTIIKEKQVIRLANLYPNRYDIQFIRKSLSKFLNIPERASWKNQESDIENEKSMTKYHRSIIDPILKKISSTNK